MKARGLWIVDAVGLGACAAVALTWYLAGVQPLLRARETRSALEQRAQEQQDRQNALKLSKKKHEEQLAQLQRRVEESTIPLQGLDHLNTRVKELSDLATAHQLRVDDIRPGAANPQPYYTGVPIRIAGQGRYQAAARFFHALGAGYDDVGITGFELKGEPEAVEKPATFSVQLLWYAAPQPAERAAAATRQERP